MAKEKGARTIEKGIKATLISYILFVVALLWIFQIVLLNSYYHVMKRLTISSAAKQIVANINEENFDSRLESICYSNGMCLIIMDNLGKEIHSIDMMGKGCIIHSPSKFTISKQIQDVFFGYQDIKVLQVQDDRFKNEGLVYVMAVENNQGERLTLILNTSLIPVQSTTDILQSQLVIITIILAIVALIMSKKVARSISKPITAITKKAKRLAEGDYIDDYEGGGIVEIEDLAETLNFSAKGLSKVEDLRRELVANVSHDLKTPLTMIKAYAEMVRDITGENPQKRNEQLEVIISESDRLSRLVTELIQVSKEDGSTLVFNKQTFDIISMVSEIAMRFESTNPEYTLKITGEKQAMVVADKESIGKVAYNLISNAINYTGTDKTVIIDVKKVEGKAVRISIIDSGRGIPQEEANLIWERYYRSKNTHQRPVAGTGLGLSIVKNALTGQNFNFGVESEVDKGSCFWFELPIA